MQEPISKLSEINKSTIKALKERIRAAGTRKVEKKIGFTPTNLSYHLNPKDFSKANVSVLNKIVEAVTAVEKENLDHARRVHDKAIS
jgi:malate/lactate dehydrogenase